MKNKENYFKKIFCFFIILFLFSFIPSFSVCDEFNSGVSQSALNIQLDKDKFFEITYSDIARTKKDDFTISFTPAVKTTLRNASKNSNQILSLIIKYDKSEPGRPPMLPLIRFFVPGSLGTTNVKAESLNTDDCKEVHNFNISAQEVSELFQNNRLDFDLLINVLGQGPANRIGQKFRITICLNCLISAEPTPTPESTGGGGGPPELPLPDLDPLSSDEEALEDLKKAEPILDQITSGVSADPSLVNKVDDITDSIINILSKIHGKIGIDSNAQDLGNRAISDLNVLNTEIDNLKKVFIEKGISIQFQNDLDTVKSLVQGVLAKLKEGKENG